jgi:hypothetical protein
MVKGATNPGLVIQSSPKMRLDNYVQTDGKAYTIELKKHLYQRTYGTTIGKNHYSFLAIMQVV